MKSFRFVAVIIALSIISAILLPVKAFAANAADWQSGNIIEDAMFVNKYDMSVDQIQSFLNSKVISCDTWGTKTSEFGGGTRAQYGASKGNPVPFTCLKDYYEVPKTSPGNWLPESNYGRTDGWRPAGSQSAAQLIWNAAQRYNINPKVLLVKLATESAGPLTSDDWPFRKQFTYAMGAHCPDSGPGGSANCDINYGGFSLQMNEAASLLRWYLDNMDQPWWQYKKPYRFNFILWNVAPSGCGGSDVYIQNRATAALYTYTPYQPNQAALNNLYGTGDGCSAYGNRNFWRVFSDLFGSTRLYNASVTLNKGLTITTPSTSGIYRGENLTASYEVRNSSAYTIKVGGLGICARNDGAYYDFGFQNDIYLAPGEIKTISYTKNLSLSGNLNIFVCSFDNNLGGWAGNFYPYDVSGNLSRSISKSVLPNPIISAGPSFNPTSAIGGQSVDVSMTLQNLSKQAVSISYPLFIGRGNIAGNFDFPADQNVTINAESSLIYTKSRSFPQAGTYSVTVGSWYDGSWSSSQPASVPGINRSASITINSNPLLSSSPQLSIANPAKGKNVTASFAVTNDALNPVTIKQIFLAARDPQNNIVDFPSDFDITIPAKSTYTYSKSRSFEQAGNYRAFIATFQNNTWDTSYPAAQDNSVSRTINFNVKDNPLIQTNLTLSPATPVRGDTVTASFDLRNDSDRPESIDMLLVGARDPQNNIVDFPADINMTIPPNTTYSYSKSRVFDKSGTYRFFVTSLRYGQWESNYPLPKDGSIVRSMNTTFKDNPVITSGLSLSPSNPSSGQAVTATFTVRNFSNNAANTGLAIVAARDPSGRIVDFPGIENMTIPANSSLTYSKSRSFSSAGNYYVFISNLYNNTWTNTFPVSADSSITRNTTLNVTP